MEDVAHCAVHRKLVEYVCPACRNLLLCKTCRRDHETGTGHASENCKEVGLAIMHQHVQCVGVRLVKWLAKGMRSTLKEVEAGLLREIDRFQESCMQTKELSKMKRLDNEGRYAELYLYANSLPAGGAENEAAMRKLNKRLLEILDKASDGLKKVLCKIAAAGKYKPTFAAYKKDEVLVVLEGESYQNEEQIVSALHSADMSKCKAVYIDNWSVVGDRVASELASRLQTHPVSALYLRGCDISDAGAEVLAQAAFLGKSFSAFCIEGSQIYDTGAKAVAEAARNSRSLTTLYLDGLGISDSGAIAVAEAVKGCPLSVLYLAGIMISDAGATAVADAVKSCPLSVFHLSSCSISDAGATAVVNAVKSCPLSVFHLVGCNISDAGATAVADAIKSCPLFAFCLGNNKMSDAGAIAVAKTMKDCPLSVLHLGSREISDSGATAVAGILSSGRCARTLSALFLEGGRVSDSGVKDVMDAVRGCLRLSAFYLSGKSISGETLARILEGVAGISTIRSVNLCLGEVSKEQMDSCLNWLQQNEVARQLKLRFECDIEAAESVCEKLAAEWNAKLAEFRVVPSIVNLFNVEVILGVPK